jgi:hypothetical protein
MQRNRPTTENPPRPTFFDGALQQWIPGEAAPRFQLRANARFVTDHRDQIARTAATQHTDQLRQETGGESLSRDIQVDVSFHRIGGVAPSSMFIARSSSRLIPSP